MKFSSSTRLTPNQTHRHSSGPQLFLDAVSYLLPTLPFLDDVDDVDDNVQALEYVDNGLRWVVCEIALPDHYEDGADASTTVEVKEVVCTSGSDWWEMRSPTKVQDWECERDKNYSIKLLVVEIWNVPGTRAGNGA